MYQSKFEKLVKQLTENIENGAFVFADVENQEVMDGAWGIAEESNINILSDKELMGAVVVSKDHEPSANDVVGAWFGSYRRGGSIFSFDLVVDPVYQGKGIGKMLFDSAMNEASSSEVSVISLEVHSDIVAKMAQKAGFTHRGGSSWIKKVDDSDFFIESATEPEKIWVKYEKNGKISFVDSQKNPALGGKQYDPEMAEKILQANQQRLSDYESTEPDTDLSNYVSEEEPEELETIGLSGEYWFDEDGSTQYADGDISDRNHESYVIERCQSEVLGHFGLSVDEFGDMESYEEPILDHIVDDMDIEDDDLKEETLENLKHDPASAIIEYLKKHGEKDPDDLVMNAYGSSRDAREYAIKNWGWSRVAGDSIETKELTRETLRVIAHGINNALDEEGKIYEYDETPDVLDLHEYSISTYTGKRFNITLRDMESGNVEGLERSDIEVAKSAATDQVKKMDMEQMPAYYRERGLMGDSYVVKYLEKL